MGCFTARGRRREMARITAPGVPLIFKYCLGVLAADISPRLASQHRIEWAKKGQCYGDHTDLLLPAGGPHRGFPNYLIVRAQAKSAGGVRACAGSISHIIFLMIEHHRFNLSTVSEVELLLSIQSGPWRFSFPFFGENSSGPQPQIASADFGGLV